MLSMFNFRMGSTRPSPSRASAVRLVSKISPIRYSCWRRLRGPHTSGDVLRSPLYSASPDSQNVR